MKTQKSRGNCSIEFLAVIAVIVLLAVLLFPGVIPKGRQKAYEKTCINNQRQIAQTIRIYAQDNGNRYPLAHGAWEALNIPPGTLTCPTAGVKVVNGYGYSYGLNGRFINDKDFGNDPSKVPFTADAVESCNNILMKPGDVSRLHTDSKVVMSFADGHVALIDNIPPFIYLDNSMSLWPPVLPPTDKAIWYGDKTGKFGGKTFWAYPPGWRLCTYANSTAPMQNGGKFTMSAHPRLVTSKAQSTGAVGAAFLRDACGLNNNFGLHNGLFFLSNSAAADGISDTGQGLALVITLPVNNNTYLKTTGVNIPQCEIWKINIGQMEFNGSGLASTVAYPEMYCTMDVLDADFKVICQVEARCMTTKTDTQQQTIDSKLLLNGVCIWADTGVHGTGPGHVQWGLYDVLNAQPFSMTIMGGQYLNGAMCSCNISVTGREATGAAYVSPWKGSDVTHPTYLVIHCPDSTAACGGSTSYRFCYNDILGSGAREPFTFQWMPPEK